MLIDYPLVSKTNFVLFHPYNKPVKESINLLINGRTIEQKEYVKYLGVLMDSTLSWKPHVDNLAKKISRSIGIMYKIRPFVKTDVLTNIYYALIHPHLLYGIQVWGSTFEIHKNKLLVIQKKAVRLILHQDRYLPDGTLHHSLPLQKPKYSQNK